MDDIRIFENAQFGTVRTVMRDGEPWFVAADVCKALDVQNHKDAIKRLDDDERTGVDLTDPHGRVQNTNIVNEPGLYSLVLGSRKPEARAFKRWITHEVIPAIRKHGGYLTPDKVEEALLNPDTLIRLATDLKAERERAKQLAAQIEANRPYTDFGQAIAANSDAILVREFAKVLANDGITIGEKRLYQWLRDHHYLMRNNQPYQRYVDQGWFALRESSITTVKGDMIRKTTLITGKGQMALLELLREAA